MAGFYCPEGSDLSSQIQCPTNSMSPPGAATQLDCHCIQSFFGLNGTCTPCLSSGLCSSTIPGRMLLPPRTWPAPTPNATTEIIECYSTIFALFLIHGLTTACLSRHWLQFECLRLMFLRLHYLSQFSSFLFYCLRLSFSMLSWIRRSHLRFVFARLLPRIRSM